MAVAAALLTSGCGTKQPTVGERMISPDTREDFVEAMEEDVDRAKERTVARIRKDADIAVDLVENDFALIDGIREVWRGMYD
jgi:hypothetical protein